MVRGEVLSTEYNKIKTSKRNETSYLGRDVTLQPQGRIGEFVEEIKEKYVGEKGCFDNQFSSYIRNYAKLYVLREVDETVQT